MHNEGTVGADKFNSTAALAICKIMGFEGVVEWTAGQKWQIQSNFPILMDSVECPLADWPSCNHSDSYSRHHVRDVFLTCQGSRSPFSLADKRGYTVTGNQSPPGILIYFKRLNIDIVNYIDRILGQGDLRVEVECLSKRCGIHAVSG